MIYLLLIQLTPFTADTVDIIRDSSVVHLIGNVKIESDSVRINCREARLYETAGTFILEKDVTIRDTNGVITADRAQYRFREKLGRLRGNVMMTSDNEVIRADSLDYDANRRYVQMYENVIIEDRKNNLTAYGRRGSFDLGRETGDLSGQPHLEVARADKPPMTVQARTFFLNTRDNRFSGYDSVVALVDSITIAADSFDYDLKREDGKLVNPRVTEKDNVLLGKRGVFKLVKKAVDLFSVADGESVYYTREGSRNYVAGSAITILFRDGKAYKIIVNGNPRGNLVNREKEKNAGD